ncbi:MAG: CRISPR-associated protein Cas5 [Saprospiraceae bacterium]
MKAALFDIKGNWAHFRKAETNNNPLTHDFITKTALVGMIGAVLGKERPEMKALFPQLCDDLLYGVRVNNHVQKQSWGFTLRSASDLFAKSPKQMEFLRYPDFTILLALKNGQSGEFFDEFIWSVAAQKSCFQPVLGLHNCPADLYFIDDGEISEQQEGEFETHGFISSSHKAIQFSRLSFDRIPTFQTDDFWNLPERYQSVVYPSNRETVRANGIYYQYNESQWFLT